MNSQTGGDMGSPSLSKKVDRRRCLHLRFFNLPLLLVIIVAVTVDGALIASPQNTAVITDQEVTLTCKTNEPDRTLRWSIKDKDSAPELIFNGDRVVPAFRDDYQVSTSDSGEYNLTFKASAKTAKRFGCYESGRDTVHSAEVIVLESSPICERNSDPSPGNLTFACKVSFSGNWIPKIVWKMGKNPQSESPASANANVYMLKSVTSHAVTCQTAFDRLFYSGNVSALNVPDPHNSAPCSLEDEYHYSTMMTLPYSTTPPPPEPYHQALVVFLGIVIGVIASAIVAALWYNRKKLSFLPCCPFGEKKPTTASLPLSTTPKEAVDV